MPVYLVVRNRVHCQQFPALEVDSKSVAALDGFVVCSTGIGLGEVCHDDNELW